jgi:hypothetical protein
MQLLPKLNENSQAGFPILATWPKDDPETIKKFKNSIVAIYFRLPGKEPKFIKWPKIKFEH